MAQKKLKRAGRKLTAAQKAEYAKVRQQIEDEKAEIIVRAKQRRSAQASGGDCISRQLRQAIRDSGLTHYAIAKQAGISPSMLDLFVKGDRSLRLDTVDKIADVLGYALLPNA